MPGRMGGRAFYRRFQEGWGGGSSRRGGGVGAGRVPCGDLFWGGGIFFFSGPKFPPSN